MSANVMRLVPESWQLYSTKQAAGWPQRLRDNAKAQNMSPYEYARLEIGEWMRSTAHYKKGRAYKLSEPNAEEAKAFYLWYNAEGAQ
jgi:hypothetical protein